MPREKKLVEPTPEQIERWASQGQTRKQMAKKLGSSVNYLNTRVNRSVELIRAELRGKLKFYE